MVYFEELKKYTQGIMKSEKFQSTLTKTSGHAKKKKKILYSIPFTYISKTSKYLKAMSRTMQKCITGRTDNKKKKFSKKTPFDEAFLHDKEK